MQVFTLLIPAGERTEQKRVYKRHTQEKKYF